MAPAGVACGIGMFLFGYTLAIGANAILCAFLQGVMMVGVLIGIFSTLSYGLDAFRSQSNEIFIMNMFFKVYIPPLGSPLPFPFPRLLQFFPFLFPDFYLQPTQTIILTLLAELEFHVLRALKLRE